MKHSLDYLCWSIALSALLFVTACKTTDSPRGRMDPEETRRRLVESRAELSALRLKLDRVEAADPAELPAVIIEQGPADDSFLSLSAQRKSAMKELTNLRYRYLEGHPKIKTQRGLLDELEEELSGKANWIRYQLKREVDVVQDTVDRLEEALGDDQAS